MVCFSKQNVCVAFMYLVCLSRMCLDGISLVSAQKARNETNKYRISSKIIDAVSAICQPKVCSMPSREPNITSRNLLRCCGGCSCAEDCQSSDAKCCFIDKGTPPDGEECLIPSTGKPTPANLYKYIRYKMIASCPSSSNKSLEDVSATDNLCQNTSVAPWGSLYPVYSHTTRTFYKNQECAVCNGDYNTTAWTLVLTCDNYHTEGHRTVDIDTYTQFYLGKDIYDVCHVNFLPPYIVSSDLLENKQCYTHYIDYCEKEEFDIPAELQLTREEVVLACESSFVSPFYAMFLYKNVFCSICSGYLLYYKDRSCEKLFLSHPSRGGATSPFTLFIDVKLMQALPHVSNHMMACNKNRKMCQEVHCPSARLRMEHGGCSSPTVAWSFQNYRVVLKLTPLTEFSDMSEITVQHFREISPWPKQWQIYAIALKMSLTSSYVEYFYVEMHAESFNRPNKVLQIVKKYSSRPWLNKNTGNKMKFLSEFLPFKSVEMYGSFLKPEFYEHPDDRSNVTELAWMILYREIGFHRYELTINKMFFCDQVELNEDEYILLHEKQVLYYIQKQQYVFDNEFVLIVTDHGTHDRVRICLEDSNLQLKAVNKIGNASKINVLSPVIILVLVMLLYLINNDSDFSIWVTMNYGFSCRSKDVYLCVCANCEA